MQLNNVNSLFLGVSMFTFGFLKFFDPFKSWYSIQINTSELGQTAYALGILGELVVGIAFGGLVLYRKTISQKTYRIISILASTVVIVMMSTGIYVHLHPHVPAEVLPLKIKPPFIPVFFLAAACLNIVARFRKPTLSN